MKVITNCLIASLCLFWVLGHTQSLPSSIPLISKKIALRDFTTLDIQGPVNVYIDATQPNSSLQILGDAKTVSAVTWKEKNHILYLGTKWMYRPSVNDRLTIKVNTASGKINQIRFCSNANLFGKGLTGTLSLLAVGTGHINLYTNKLNLKSLYSNGKENILLHNIYSSKLSVKTHNADNIKILGEVDLNSINFTGDGNLIVYWVNSPYLKINATGRGKIVLAGVAKVLDVDLTQKTHLFAKQLNVQQGFIKTQKHAQVEVKITSKLRAYAKDNSVIYYYPPIKFLSVYTEGAGLILNKNN